MIEGRNVLIALYLSFLSPRITTFDHLVSSRFFFRIFSLLSGEFVLICLTVLSKATTVTSVGSVGFGASLRACLKRFSWPA